MVKINEQIEEINKVSELLSKTTSHKRRHDLLKYRNRLVKELMTAQHLMRKRA